MTATAHPYVRRPLVFVDAGSLSTHELIGLARAGYDVALVCNECGHEITTSRVKVPSNTPFPRYETVYQPHTLCDDRLLQRAERAS